MEEICKYTLNCHSWTVGKGFSSKFRFNPLNAELNPICYLLALLRGATIVVVSRLRVKPYREIKKRHCKRPVSYEELQGT